MINTARLLKFQAPVVEQSLRPYAVTHHSRPGFVEMPNGSWLNLSVQPRRQAKPKARRRLWHWLASIRQNKE